MSAAQHKTFRLGQRKAAATPSAEQLAAINAFTLRDFAADELHVRTFVLCHSAVDRDGEVFDEALLADFAKTLKGKGVFVKHPTGYDGDSGPGEGLVFDTHLETMSLESAQELMRGQKLVMAPDRGDVTVVLADTFFPKTPDNAALLTKLDAGVACFVSVGFTAEGGRKQITDAAGHEYEIRRWHAPGEAHEMSLVWLGAQPGARAVKSAPRTEATDMELKDQLTAEQAKTAALTAERDAAKAAAANHDALKAALGEDAALADDVTAIAALVGAGKTYRSALVDAVVKADRLAGTVADDDASVAAAAKDYAALPLPALKRLAERAQAGAEELVQSGIKGSDPNLERPNGGKAAGAFDSPVFQP